MKKLIILLLLCNVFNLYSQTNSEPFSEQNTIQNVQVQDNQEYVPFDDVIINTVANNKNNKWCEYCGANMNANCHAHAKWCPYYCNEGDDHGGGNSLPIGNGTMILFTFLGIYTIFKLKQK